MPRPEKPDSHHGFEFQDLEDNMLLNALNVIYVLIAIAMTAFILLQRGAGATAGASFGAGASATVFGSRGASSFLTRSTAVLATLFFVLTLGMGMYVSRGSVIAQEVDLGVMGAPTTGAPARPAPALDVPQAPGATPAAAPSTPPAGAAIVAPAQPVAAAPADVPASPAAQTGDKPPR